MVVISWVGLSQGGNLPLAVQPHRHSGQAQRRIDHIKGEFKASVGDGQGRISLIRTVTTPGQSAAFPATILTSLIAPSGDTKSRISTIPGRTSELPAVDAAPLGAGSRSEASDETLDYEAACAFFAAARLASSIGNRIAVHFVRPIPDAHPCAGLHRLPRAVPSTFHEYVAGSLAVGHDAG